MYPKDKKGVLDLFGEIQKLKYLTLRKELKDSGIHPSQIYILLLIYKNPGISQKEIADKLFLTPATIAIMIKKMEKNNLIKKEINQNDRREYKVFLTKKSKHIITKLEKVMENFEKLSLKGFKKEEIEILENLLKKIIKNLKDYKDE